MTVRKVLIFAGIVVAAVIGESIVQARGSELNSGQLVMLGFAAYGIGGWAIRKGRPIVARLRQG